MAREQATKLTWSVERICWQVAEKGFYALFLALPLTFSTATADLFDLPKVTVLRLLTIVILSALSIRALARGSVKLSRTRLDVPILAYLGACLIATFHTMSVSFSLYGEYARYEGLITIANYAILFFLATSILDRQERIERALQVMVVTGSITAAIAVAQTVGLQLYPGDNLAEFQGRVFSTLGNPDFLGAYLVLTIPVAIGLLLNTADRRFKSGLVLGIVLMVVGLVLSYTRGAWIGFAVSVPVFLFAWRSVWKNRYWVGTVSIILLVIIAAIEVGGPARIESAVSNFFAPTTQRLAPPTEQAGGGGVVSRIQSSTDLTGGTIVVRFQTWQAALGIIRDNPVIGVGLNSLQMAMNRYIPMEYARGEGFDHMPDKPHNEFLQIAASTGIIGLGAYLAVLVAFAGTIARWMRRSSRSSLYPVAAGILAAWIGYLVQDSFLFGVIGTSSQFWLLMGAGTSLCLSRQLEARPVSWRVPRAITVGATIVVGVIAIYAGFLAVRPAIADYYMNRGNASFHAKSATERNVEDALANYRLAIGWAPYVQDYREMYTSVLTYEAMGTKDLSAQRRALDEAVMVLNDAIAQNPQHAALYNARAATYAAYGNDHQLDAYRDYQTVVELRPYDYYDNLQVANFAHQFGDIDRAIVAERTVLQIFPHDHQATYQLANDYITKGRLEEAATILERVLKRDAKDKGAILMLAIIDEANGDTTAALAKYESVLKITPENEPAKKALERLKAN